jgi:hypothetical protein
VIGTWNYACVVFRFYVSYLPTIGSPTTMGTSPEVTNQAEGVNQTLVISVSATVLGALLLLVFVTLVILVCVLLRKRKPTEVYRVNTSLHRNTYETGIGAGTPKSAANNVKLQEPDLVESASPVPPTDPEYATISEWRKISGLPQPGPGIGVTNPFYASSSVCIPNASGCVDSMETSFSHISSLDSNPYLVKQRSTAHSLQDMRSVGLRDAKSPHTKDTTLSPSLGRCPMTLGSGGSVRNIPSHAVRRNESMRADIGSGHRPVPLPHPVMRNASLNVGRGEPYLMAHQLGSPLALSMRAGNRKEVSWGEQDEC